MDWFDSLTAKWWLIFFFLMALLGLSIYAVLNDLLAYAIVYLLCFGIVLFFAYKELNMDFLRSFVD